MSKRHPLIKDSLPYISCGTWGRVHRPERSAGQGTRPRVPQKVSFLRKAKKTMI